MRRKYAKLGENNAASFRLKDMTWVQLHNLQN